MVAVLVVPAQTQDLIASLMLHNLIDSFMLSAGQVTLATFESLSGESDSKSRRKFDPKSSQIPTGVTAALDPIFQRYFSVFFTGKFDARVPELFSGAVAHLPISVERRTAIEAEMFRLDDAPATASGAAQNYALKRGGSVSHIVLWYRGEVLCRKAPADMVPELSRFCVLNRMLHRTPGSPDHASMHEVYLRHGNVDLDDGDGGKRVVSPFGPSGAAARDAVERSSDGRGFVNRYLPGRNRRRMPRLVLYVGFRSFLCACVLRRNSQAVDDSKKSAKSGLRPALRPPVVLARDIKAILRGLVQSKTSENLDSLIKSELNVTVPSERFSQIDMERRDPTALAWTDHARTARAQKGSLAGPASAPTALAGPYNALFYYMSVFHLPGVLISSRSRFAAEDVICAHFLRAVIRIHGMFRRNDRSRAGAPNEAKGISNNASSATMVTQNKTQSVYLSRIQEVALRFRVQGSSQLGSLFWVVGRRYHPRREVYVCHHDSVPQDAVDFAFKLNFSL